MESVHLLLKSTDKLKAGQKGRLELSLFKMNVPEQSAHLISTVIGDQGGLLKLQPSDIFDNVVAIKNPISMGFEEFIEQLHVQDVQKYEKSEKRRIDAILKSEIDKLNRWLIDEKQAISIHNEKMKNKITNLKRQFKMEKNFTKKVALQEQIKKMQQQMNERDFNTFDIERELERKCNRLIGGKKRSLKIDYTIEPVFNLTWEVE